MLGFVVADLLHRREPGGHEGVKSKRARRARGGAEPGRSGRSGLGLPALLRLGRGEEKTGGRKKAGALGRTPTRR